MTPTLSADLTEALVALWVDYAGVAPTDAHTHIDGNTVTCVLVDGVCDFNIATDRTLEGYKPHGVAMTLANYKREAVSEVTRVTHQRVTSFLSSHDPDTDVATEIFTLEASLGRGAPHGTRKIKDDNGIRRDRDADLRDLDAQARDATAQALDQMASGRESRHAARAPLSARRLHEVGEGIEAALTESAEESRGRAAKDRTQAAFDRELAALDREAAAQDRTAAKADREELREARSLKCQCR